MSPHWHATPSLQQDHVQPLHTQLPSPRTSACIPEHQAGVLNTAVDMVQTRSQARKLQQCGVSPGPASGEQQHSLFPRPNESQDAAVITGVTPYDSLPSGWTRSRRGRATAEEVDDLERHLLRLRAVATSSAAAEARRHSEPVGATTCNTGRDGSDCAEAVARLKQEQVSRTHPPGRGMHVQQRVHDQLLKILSFCQLPQATQIRQRMKTQMLETLYFRPPFRSTHVRQQQTYQTTHPRRRIHAQLSETLFYLQILLALLILISPVPSGGSNPPLPPLSSFLPSSMPSSAARPSSTRVPGI